MKPDLPLSMLVQCEGYFCTASRGLTLGARLAVLWLILGSDVSLCLPPYLVKKHK